MARVRTNRFLIPSFEARRKWLIDGCGLSLQEEERDMG